MTSDNRWAVQEAAVQEAAVQEADVQEAVQDWTEGRTARTAPLGTVLHRCPFVFGELNRLPGALRLTTYEQATLLDWALYDERRQLIADSAYLRAADGMKVLGGDVATAVVPGRIPHVLPPGRYFWVGPMHTHFGHFLVSTLGRLWALAELDPREFVFLYTGGLPPAELLARHGFIRECFAALGLPADRLVQVLGPLCIPDVTVAEPSLLENFGASPLYATTLGRIRASLAPDAQDNTVSHPVYVSKERVASGIRTVANEAAVTSLLREAGVEVAYPDTLPFADQIRFWCAHRAVAGFSGSAFHMAGFGRDKRLCTVFGYSAASANQIAIDGLVGNRHLHLHAGTGMRGLGATPSFQDVLSIDDPARFAAELLGVMADMDAMGEQAIETPPRSSSPFALGQDPFGTNLAHGRPVSVNASGAEPGWWQVELAGPSHVYEVRVFGGAAAPARFRVSLGAGGGWADVHDHDGPPPGGPDAPFRWRAPGTSAARLVRLTRLDAGPMDVLAVEVFGEPA